MTSPRPARQSPLSRSSRAPQYPLSRIEEGYTTLVVLDNLRFATGSQIQRILFDRTSGSPRMARHRATRALRRLFDTGFTRRVSVFAPSATSNRMSMQIVHVLSPAGAHAVGADPRQVRNRSPKDGQVLTHDFWLMEVATLAMAGCPTGLAVTNWWDDRILAGRKRQGLMSLANIPDGLLVVQNQESGKVFPSFVELDLGTESVTGQTAHRRDFARKIESYLDYTPETFQAEFGVKAAPIVLIVADSERRLASLRTTTQRLGGGGRYWFSTLDQFRGMGGSERQHDIDSEARQGPFWGLNWQTAANDEWRGLATRCGV